MWNYFKKVLISFSAVALGVILFMGILIIPILIAVSTASTSADGEVAPGSILKITLDQQIKEQSKEGLPFDLGAIPGASDLSANTLGVYDIVKAIEAAAEDENIEGIYLSVSGVNAGFAQMTEIRDALLTFKQSDKFIISYADYMSEGAYYIASLSDEIVLNPEGYMEFNGLGAQIPFFKKMLAKVGVKPIVFKVGEYKSAVEPYLLDKMSDPARKQAQVYLNGLYSKYLLDVSNSLNIPIDTLAYLSDNMSVQTPKDALKYRMVTKLAYLDDVLAMFKEKTETKSTKDLKFVDLANYASQNSINKGRKSGNRIAVVVAEGEIVDSGDPDSQIVGQDLAAEIRKLRENDKISAIVLRINSPGGSKVASDVVWREVMETKKAGKPIIASMSNVAASGGYYIAMGCDKIIAQPNTITGSIGIFGLMFNIKELMNEHIGITFDEVNTGKYASLGASYDEMSEGEKAFFTRMVEEGYQDFITKVGQGRGISPDSVNAIGQGRVWTGQDALAIGLVDQLGNLDDAISLAAEMAELEADDYKIWFYPKQQDFFEKILDQGSSTHIAEKTIRQELGDFYPLYQEVKKLHQHTGIQARMHYSPVIK